MKQNLSFIGLTLGEGQKQVYKILNSSKNGRLEKNKFQEQIEDSKPELT